MPSEVKELRFFAFDETNPYHNRAKAYRVRSLSEYARHFAGSEGRKAVGEASPNYLRSPVAASKIQQVLPSVRLIASLRNPADRLFSQYQMELRAGGARKKFDEAVFGRDAAMIKAAFYFMDLKRYYDRFSAQQIKITLFDDLTDNPLRVTRDLYRFIGVDEHFTPDLTPQNEGGVPRNRIWQAAVRQGTALATAVRLRPPALARTWRSVKRASLRKVSLDPVVRRKILEICHEDILETQRLIGCDLSHWLQAGVT